MKAVLTSMLLAALALGLTGCPVGTQGTSSTGNNGTNTGTN